MQRHGRAGDGVGHERDQRRPGPPARPVQHVRVPPQVAVRVRQGAAAAREVGRRHGAGRRSARAAHSRSAAGVEAAGPPARAAGDGAGAIRGGWSPLPARAGRPPASRSGGKPGRAAVGLDLHRERVVARAVLGLGTSGTGGPVLARPLAAQADAVVGEGGEEAGGRGHDAPRLSVFPLSAAPGQRKRQGRAVVRSRRQWPRTRRRSRLSGVRPPLRPRRVPRSRSARAATKPRVARPACGSCRPARSVPELRFVLPPVAGAGPIPLVPVQPVRLEASQGVGEHPRPVVNDHLPARAFPVHEPEARLQLAHPRAWPRMATRASWPPGGLDAVGRHGDASDGRAAAGSAKAARMCATSRPCFLCAKVGAEETSRSAMRSPASGRRAPLPAVPAWSSVAIAVVRLIKRSGPWRFALAGAIAFLGWGGTAPRPA